MEVGWRRRPAVGGQGGGGGGPVVVARVVVVVVLWQHGRQTGHTDPSATLPPKTDHFCPRRPRRRRRCRRRPHLDRH